MDNEWQPVRLVSLEVFLKRHPNAHPSYSDFGGKVVRVKPPSARCQCGARSCEIHPEDSILFPAVDPDDPTGWFFCEHQILAD